MQNSPQIKSVLNLLTQPATKDAPNSQPILIATVVVCRKPPSSVSWLKRFQIYSTIIHLYSVRRRAAWLIKSMYKTLYKCAVKLPFVAQTSPCKLCYVQLPSDTNLAMFPARLGLRSSLGESARLTDFFDSQMPVFHQC